MSSSILAWRWVIESLAAIPDVGTSILSALVDKFPDVLADSSGAVRERLALRYVEECSGMACGEIPPVVAANASSPLKIDASKTCEEVLLSKMTTSNDIAKGKTDLDGADLHHFVLLKKAALPKSSIDLLKEKILGSYHPESSHSKEINNLPDLPKVSRPCLANTFTSNNHRDHDDIRKLIRNLKYANPWLKKFTVTRRYRRLKKLDSTPSKSIGGRVSQNISSSQKHLEEQNASFGEKRNQQTNVDVGTCNVDDGSTPLKSIDGRVSQNISSSWKHLEEQNASFMEKRDQQTNVDDGTCNVDFIKPAKINASTFEEESAEFHEVNLPGYAQAPNGPSENFIELLAQFGEQSENPQNIIHDRCEFGQQSPKQQNIRHDNSANSQKASSDCGDVPLLKQNSTHQSSHAQNSCIVCHRSGSLLDCLGNGCSRSIHESCSGLLSTVVKNGRFYCPLCYYKKAQLSYTKAKRRLEKARRNIFLYSDNCPACAPRKGCAHHNQCTHPDLHSDKKNFCRSAGEKKYYETQNAETRSKSDPGVAQNQQDDVSYKIILPRKKTIECDTGQVCQVTPIRGQKSCRVTEYQQPVVLRASPERNNIDASVINSRNEVCMDHLQVGEIQNLHTGDNDREKQNLLSRECDYNAKRKALASQIGDRFCHPSRRDGKTIKTDNYQMAITNQQTDNLSSRELRTSTHRQQNLQSINPKGPSSIRRTMLIWKPEEEQALEEAMLKIPRNIDGSIPWIKILEYTRPVLHESRTPIDLKDKWRNMQKKVKKRRRRD